MNDWYPKWISLNWSQFIIKHLLPFLFSLLRWKPSLPMITLFNSFNPSISNRFTFIKQSPSISSLSIPFRLLASNTFKSCAFAYSNRFALLESYSSSITSRYSFCCRMNRLRESASHSLSVSQSYLNYAILLPLQMVYLCIPSQFLLHSVMECLIQIQSSIITIQLNFAYTIEIVTISFECSQRREI